MVPNESPFNDPEFQAALAARGMVHTPGMADSVMAELAPLMKAEGIDLESLGDEVSPAQLNAAFAAANERRNLELFTPVGAERRSALRNLGEVAIALAAGDEETALETLDLAETEPDGDTPAISHVIGAALGLLDTWLTERASETEGYRLAEWDPIVRTAAAFILTTCAKGQGLASLHTFHLKFDGLELHHGSALAFSAVITALAENHDTALDEEVRALLDPGHGATTTASGTGGAGQPRTGGGQGASSAKKAKQAKKQRRGSLDERWLLRGYTSWAHTSDDLALEEGSAEVLQALFDLARTAGLHLARPEDVDTTFDILALMQPQGERAEQRIDMIGTVRDYCRFRAESRPQDAVWADAAQHSAAVYRAALQGQDGDDEDDEFGDLADELDEVIEEALRMALDAPVDVGAARAAALELAWVSGVRGFLEWLGKGRPMTRTGQVQRKDIATVAAFAGVDAVGAASIPSGSPRIPGEGTVPVQSFSDIAELAAWWRALDLAGIIEFSSSRMIPGEHAGTWLSQDGPDDEALWDFVALTVAEVVMPHRVATAEGLAFAAYVARHALLRILAGLMHREPAFEAEEVDPGVWLDLRDQFDPLVRLGLIVCEPDDVFMIPEALRWPVASGGHEALQWVRRY